MLASFGSWFSTAVVQPTFLAVASGILAGTITGGALIAGGVIPPPGPADTALLACPGSGAVVARVPAGQSLLATARSEDGAWLQVYIGQPGIDGAWAPAAAVQLQGSMEGLPVADCAAPSSAEPTPQPLPSPAPTPEPSVLGTIVPTLEPSPSPTPSLAPGVSPKPTPAPTVQPTPTVTPKPTTHTPPPTIPPSLPPTDSPPPPNNAPSVSNLATNSVCIDAANSATITVTATDPDVGDTLMVRMRMGYRDSLNNQYYRIGGTQTMSPAGGSTYTFTLTGALFTSWGWNTWPEDREITYDVTAYDSHGGVSGTLYSHNDLATQVWYRPVSSCFIP